MAESIKELLRQLDKVKDATSSEARSIRRKLREAGHFISGKKGGKKGDNKKSRRDDRENKKEKSRRDDDEDD